MDTVIVIMSAVSRFFALLADSESVPRGDMIPALTALVAVFLSPFISVLLTERQVRTSLQIAERQIKSAVLATNRQEWINTLRHELARFVSIGSRLAILARGPVEKERFCECIEQLTLVRTKILLLLNPNEADHVRLMNLLERMTEVVYENRDSETIADFNQKVIVVSQPLLKREWERVKKVE